MDCSCINLNFTFSISITFTFSITLKMSIYVEKLKNIDRKTLVIFQLPRSPREIHACFIPTRDGSIGRHVGFTQS
jgi:hypothetical protein